MPDIFVKLDSFGLLEGDIYLQGQCFVDNDETQVGWGVTVGWNDTPAQINSACINAAIAEVDNALSIQVGMLDNRTLIGGAVGL